jgi:hypothetical protein
VRLILVFDAGYARVDLIKDFNRSRQAFLVRARRNVIVRLQLRGRRRRLSVGRLPHRTGQPRRYRHVLYHSQKAEPVDVIVYRERGFEEPWFLLVPPDSESWLPTEEVVRLYRQRMQIEHCFRDWKSHLGLRGLHLQVEKSPRLLRLLMGFTLAYLITVGARPARRTPSALLRTDPPLPPPRRYPRAQYPLHGPVSALRSSLGATGAGALVADSRALGAGPWSGWAPQFLALKRPGPLSHLHELLLLRLIPQRVRLSGSLDTPPADSARHH